uniref:Putative malate dehydrogenase 1B n=1 Tax=Ailuropoda melanoleuca TaxID=9646 RepID=A0A7N5K0B0_AILME
MAKFVLAGRADCPYYAKAELLADYLQKNLPNFRVHKITQHPRVWELYYGVTSSMTTELMKVIAQENLETHREKELEEETRKDLVHPLQVWITSASAPACYSLIPILTSGEVFGMHTEISLNLLDNKQTEENLHIIVTETRDLVAPLLRSVSICTRVEDAFRQAHVIIILDEVTDQEVHTLEDCIRSRLPLCRLYGYLIEKNAHNSVRVIVGGKTFVNLKTVLLMRYAPNVAHNIVAVALGVEGRARAVLARKLRTTPSSIKNVIVWGNISGNNYIDLRKARIYRYESAIWGPPNYSRPVLSLMFDSEWVNRQYVETLQKQTATGKQFGAILAAHSIATTLKYWYHGSPPGEIVSLGVLSEGQFGIPEGIVFSMPVKFENGTWVVLTDLKDIEISEQIMTRMTSDLIQEKLVALGDLISFQPYQSETDLAKRDENTTLPTTYDNQENQGVSDEVDFLDLVLQPISEKPYSQEAINDSEDKSVEDQQIN